MGCTDRQSNFQRMIFRDGTWGAVWGQYPSWEGPDAELIKEFPEFHEPAFVKGDVAYSVERTGADTALIRPLGHIMIENS